MFSCSCLNPPREILHWILVELKKVDGYAVSHISCFWEERLFIQRALSGLGDEHIPQPEEGPDSYTLDHLISEFCLKHTKDFSETFCDSVW